MSGVWTVSFDGSEHAAIDLAEGAPLSEHLTIVNSPILFGCRTGLCGTCACVLVSGNIPGPDEDEQEVLDLQPPVAGLRLACQIRLMDDIVLRAL